MKVPKYILSILLVTSLLIGGSLNLSAYTITQTHIIDNDDAQGYSNGRVGFDTVIHANYLYYGDARIQSCNYPGSAYYYYFTPYGGNYKIYGQVSAYLNHSKFTDPRAAYYINDYSYSSSAFAGYINQNLAPGGWNSVGIATATIHSADGLYSTRRVELVPSNTSGCFCGADTIKVALGH